MQEQNKIQKILSRYRIHDHPNDEYFNDQMPSVNRLFGLMDLLEYYGANKEWKVIEIGSYSGASSELIAQYVKEITCCDIWEQYITPLERALNVYKIFQETKKRNENIIECKKKSDELVNEYNNNIFDMIYIDADHSYESTKNNILKWFSKIKNDGIVCGHDYFMGGVKQAVDEVFDFENIKIFKDSSWSYIKKNKKEKNKFSIIIPTYKRIELLNRAMNSVKDQDYENYEVIICSDGYSEEDKQCVLNMNDNRFIYNFIEKKEFKNWGHAQRNAMHSKCTGDYTIWLDDDNTIEKDYLSFSNNELINDQYGMLVYKIKHNACGIIPRYKNITYGNIDTLNVMIRTDIAKKTEWGMSYDADFFAIKNMEKKCLENNLIIVYFEKIIGVHN